MTLLQIQEVFTKPYNQATWKQFLGETFAHTRLLIKPENLKNIDQNGASFAQKLGYIILDENGIDRNIGVYDVTLADGVILERNRVGLRNLLRKYWKNIDGAFIVYHRPENNNWRFTYVSELTGYDAEGEFIEIKTEPKRYTYLLGENESVKTAVERFETLIKKGKNLTLDDVKEAFSVEKLSKTFFDQYKKQYDLFCQYMVSQKGILHTIFNGDEKAIRDFNKKLLGRIVFLYFLQKKGWLGVPKNQVWGEGDLDFLTNQFNNFPHQELFYQDFLAVLFFDTLNTKRNHDLIELIKHNPCRIPYLNGGLFEEDDQKQRNLIFPAHLFENLFNFFNQYNFTIYEDDPNDHTVAVDPEMLGHIFENLLEDNKDKGAYYTPKEIVHYMCQESLIEYLTTYCLNFDFSDLKITLTEENQRDLITQFIKNKEINLTLFKESKELKELWLSQLNNALDTVKICDPAIGSGAFPMGLLQEIFTAKQTLFMLKYGNTNNFNASEVKLNIIQNSIYGVDIEKGAVDIARLRFWLSLIVDEPEPKALPNLDYKIVVGNSLVSKLEDEIIEIDWEMKGYKQTNVLYDVSKPEAILKEISEKQREFFSPDSNKKILAGEIRNLKIDLLISQLELMIKEKGMENKPTSTGKKLTNETKIYLQTMGWKNIISQLKVLKKKPDLSLNFFDWKLDFPEVINPYLFTEDKDSPEVATTNQQIKALNAQIDAINLHLSQHNLNIHLCHLQANIVQSQIVIIKQQLLEIEAKIKDIYGKINNIDTNIVQEVDLSFNYNIQSINQSIEDINKRIEIINPQIVRQQNSSMGFDIVIGNPPYFNIQTLGAKSSYVEQIKQKYSEIWMDKSDILFYFIKQGIEITKQKGNICYIISNAFLFSDKAQKLRNFILEKAPIKTIVNFEKYSVFESAMITTAIVTFKKDKIKTIAQALNLQDQGKNDFTSIVKNQDNFIDVNLKFDHVFALVNNDAEKLNNKIDANTKPLGKLVLIGKGMETAANNVYSNDEIDNQGFPIELLKKRLNGKAIKKYYIDRKFTDDILYFEQFDTFENLPMNLKKYLSKNKSILENRATVKNEGRIWWRYSRPMHKEYYHLNKIWTSYRSAYNCFAFDDTQEYIGLTNTTVIFDTNSNVISLKYILGLLNSKLLDYRYKSIGKQTGGGIFEYFENGISKLPITVIPLKSQNQLITIVDQIITLKSQGKDTIKLEQEIDNLVYKLYELSYEEVKIIDPEFSLTEKEYEEIKIV